MSDVNKAVIHSDDLAFGKAGLDIRNQGRKNEAIYVEASGGGWKVQHEWDEERDKKGTRLDSLKEHRHVWNTWFISPQGELAGRRIAATDWQPIQGRVELVTEGFHV